MTTPDEVKRFDSIHRWTPVVDTREVLAQDTLGTEIVYVPEMVIHASGSWVALKTFNEAVEVLRAQIARNRELEQQLSAMWAIWGG